MHSRKHSPPALALLLPRERALQNKAGHFKLITCTKTSSLGFEAWCFVYSSLPLLSKLLTPRYFGAGRLRLSGLSPSAVNWMDEVCHRCPGCYLSSSQSSWSGSRRRHRSRPGCCTLLALWKRQHEPNLRLQRAKVFPGEPEAHIAVKCMQEFIMSLVEILFAQFQYL